MLLYELVNMRLWLAVHSNRAGQLVFQRAECSDGAYVCGYLGLAEG